MPKKLHTKKEEKLLKRFWDRPPPLNLDGHTDGQTDDGKLGIRIAPLPDGTAELKIYWKTHIQPTIYTYKPNYCFHIHNTIYNCQWDTCVWKTSLILYSYLNLTNCSRGILLPFVMFFPCRPNMMLLWLLVICTGEFTCIHHMGHSLVPEPCQVILSTCITLNNPWTFGQITVDSCWVWLPYRTIGMDESRYDIPWPRPPGESGEEPLIIFDTSMAPLGWDHLTHELFFYSESSVFDQQSWQICSKYNIACCALHIFHLKYGCLCEKYTCLI